MGLVHSGSTGSQCCQGELRARRIVEGDLHQLWVLRENLPQITEFVFPTLACPQRGFLVLVRSNPLELTGPGTAGQPALGLHALAPGGELALEIGDEVGWRVEPFSIGRIEHW